MGRLAEVFPFLNKVRLPLDRDQVVLLLTAFMLFMLGVDTFLAHSISGTIRPGEWIPILFGPAAGALLGLAGLIALRRRTAANIFASIVFLASLAVGALGTYFHLARAVIPAAPAGQQFTTAVLLYAPPVLGPLTFALVAVLGISAAWQEEKVDSGRLRLFGGLRLNMPLSKTRAYFLLVAVFTLATLISSVIDHARTNFVNPWLWLPTFAGAFATLAALFTGVIMKPTRGDLAVYTAAMLLMMAVGAVGAGLHVLANRTGQGALIIERMIRGAPVLAPLLFANMGLLGLIVLLDPRGPREK